MPRRASRASRCFSAKLVAKVDPVDIGASCWVPAGGDQVWASATVRAQQHTLLSVELADGSTASLDIGYSDLFLGNPSVVPDMTALHHIHEPGILHNLQQRADPEAQTPYTFMASVLIAMNPLRRLEAPPLGDYRAGAAAPHPYAIAETARKALRVQGNQSVVISGESGAGKTETAKIVLYYLTCGDGEQSELDSRILQSSPVLEAFGNAKTSRNNNSSRFGKFMKLEFSPDGRYALTGATIDTYLLEQSRVVAQVKGERNFHVFYQLLAGASPADSERLRLAPAASFRYLNESGCVEVPGVDDAADFASVLSALACVQIDQAQTAELLQLLAAVLHLGNLAFSARESDEGEVADLAPAEAAALEFVAASLLGVGGAQLAAVLCERVMVTRGETFTIHRRPDEAASCRDAVAKALYARTFAWIVDKVNVSLGHREGELPFIGVLDIFGFESFERNDFEQLLINFANETLQCTFNQQVFDAELELYREEAIACPDVTCPSNRECVELIGGRPKGVLALLEAACAMPNGSEETFNQTLHAEHERSRFFPRPHPKDKRDSFIVQHFAGRVQYTVGAFLAKNSDLLPEGLAALMAGSSAPVVSSLFPAAPPQEERKRKRAGVCGQFARQMEALVALLNATRCSFIRCIKPNAAMRFGEFDRKYVVEQLRCLGLLQTCEVLKVGLPTRVAYEEVLSVYRPALPEEALALFEGADTRTLIAAILWAGQVPSDSFRLGRSRVFFKAGQLSRLEALLHAELGAGSPFVERLRRWLVRRRWRVAFARVFAQRALVAQYERLQLTRQRCGEARQRAEAASIEVADAASAVEEQRREAGELCAEVDALTAPLEAQINALRERVGEAACGEAEEAARRANRAAEAVRDTTGDAEGWSELIGASTVEIIQLCSQVRAACSKCQVDKAQALLDSIDKTAAQVRSEIESARVAVVEARAGVEEVKAALAAVEVSQSEALQREAEALQRQREAEALQREAEARQREAEAEALQREAEARQREAEAEALQREAEAEARQREAEAEEKRRQEEKGHRRVPSLPPTLPPTPSVSTPPPIPAAAASIPQLPPAKTRLSDIKPSAAAAATAAVTTATATAAVTTATAGPAAVPVPVPPPAERPSGPPPIPASVAESRVPSAVMAAIGGPRGGPPPIPAAAVPPPRPPSGLPPPARAAGGAEDDEDLPPLPNTVPFEPDRKLYDQFHSKKGYLIKRSRHRHAWEQRFFSLDGTWISYFKKQRDATGPPKGQMELTATSTAEYSDMHENALMIRTKKEVVYLAAASDEDRDEWILAINANINAFRYGGVRDLPYTLDPATFLIPDVSYYRFPDSSAPDDSLPILTAPALDAPATGLCIFPGQTVQAAVLVLNGSDVFVRILHALDPALEIYGFIARARVERVVPID